MEKMKFAYTGSDILLFTIVKIVKETNNTNNNNNNKNCTKIVREKNPSTVVIFSAPVTPFPWVCNSALSTLTN